MSANVSATFTYFAKTSSCLKKYILTSVGAVPLDADRGLRYADLIGYNSLIGAAANRYTRKDHYHK